MKGTLKGTLKDLGRNALQDALLVALALFAFDVVYLSQHTQPTATSLLLLFSECQLAAAAVSAYLLALHVTIAIAQPRWPALEGTYLALVRAFAFAALALPQVVSLLSLRDGLGPGTVIALGVLLVFLAIDWWLVYRRKPEPIALAVIALFAAGLVLALVRSDPTFIRISVRRVDNFFFYSQLVSFSGLALAVLLLHCHAGATGQQIAKRHNVLALVLGLSAGGVLISVADVFTQPLRYAAVFVATVLLHDAVPFVSRRLKVQWCLPLFCVALGGLGYAATGSRSLLDAEQAVGTSSAFSREIFRLIGTGDAAVRRLEALALPTPEYQRGRRSLEETQRWNTKRARTPSAAANYSVLLVTIDAMRADEIVDHPLHCPNLARFAQNAFAFQRAYTQGGWTSLAIPALLWSKYPRAISFVPLWEDIYVRLYLKSELPRNTAVSKLMQAPLLETAPNLAALLAARSYRTVAINNDGYTGYFAPRLGFNRSFGETYYPKDVLVEQAATLPNGTDLDLVAALKTIEILTKPESQRLFIWTHLFAPHSPYKPPADRHNPFPRSYAGEVWYVDQLFGDIIKAAKGSALAQKLIVVVAGDHGESFGEHGFRTHGLTLYESGVRVPLLISIPGAGSGTIAPEVGTVDMVPTVLDLVDAPIPASVEGRTLLPYMFEKETSTPPVFLETWKTNPLTLSKTLHLIAVVEDRKKLMFDVILGTFALFDLRRDPDENDNLAGQADPESQRLLQHLAGLLFGWRDGVDERSQGAAAIWRDAAN